MNFVYTILLVAFAAISGYMVGERHGASQVEAVQKGTIVTGPSVVIPLTKPPVNVPHTTPKRPPVPESPVLPLPEANELFDFDESPQYDPKKITIAAPFLY